MTFLSWTFNNKENTSICIIQCTCPLCLHKITFFRFYIEYAFSKYSSRSFRLIRRLFPHQITKWQFLSFVSSRSLFIPMPKYAEASSNVRFDFSHIGTSFLITVAPSHHSNGKSLSSQAINSPFLSRYNCAVAYSVIFPEASYTITL